MKSLKFASLCILLLTSFELHAQGTKSIRLSFYVDGVLHPLTPKDKLYLVSKSDTINGWWNEQNQINFSSEPTQLQYDLVFVKEKDTLLFEKTDLQLLKPGQDFEWWFGIDNKPFDRELGLLTIQEYAKDTLLRKLNYWQLLPQEEGDGIQIAKKVY